MMVVPPQEGLANNTLSADGGSRSYGHMSVGNSEASRRYTEDEAELREAALNRQPMPSSKVLLPRKDKEDGKGLDDNDMQEVDVMHMTRTQNKLLVDRVLETEDQEAFALLKKFHDRRKKAGVPQGTVEVRFQNLNVEAPIGVGTSGLPSITNSYLNVVTDLLGKLHIKTRKKHDFSILSDVSGTIPPGRICLLLGPPGSGKTTLLEALAGKLDEGGARQRSGTITYNGKTFDQFVPERTSAYVTQYDEHMAELTVRETLDFSRRVQGAGNRPAEMEALRAAEKERGIDPDPELAAFMKANTLEGKRESIHTQYVLHTMGLDVCADTLVGSSMVRGISGGQKKRVTTSEMICGPKRTLFMDEISTGLDSSTTYQIVRNLRDYAHLAEATVLVALLQPAPEVFDLFDDVMLLSEGHLLFHGPCKEVMPFFQGLGFDIPERKGIPDFLQEVSGLRDQEAYWSRDEPYRFVPVTEIAEAFRNSKVGKSNAAHLEEPFEETEISNEALITKRYALSPQQELVACFQREWTLIKRTAFIYVFKTFQVFLMGIIAATLWLRTQTHPISVPDANKYASYTFFSLIILIFNGIAEMSITIERLPIFAKQRDNMFYRAISYVMPVTIMRIPYSAVEAVVWSNLTYWEINMAPVASRYFMFLVLCFLVHQWSVGFFRMIGAICRNLTIANSVGLMAMLATLLCGGFVITKHSIHPWVVWLYWISPMQYAQRALMINEMPDTLVLYGKYRLISHIMAFPSFTASRWQDQVYATAGPYAGQTLGNGILSQFGFPHEYKWVWIGACYLVFCNILFNFVLILAHQYLGALAGSAPVKSQEQLLDHEEALYGEQAAHLQGQDGSTAVDMSRRGSSRKRSKTGSRRQMGTSRRAMGSSRRMKLGGDPEKTLNKGPAQGQTQGQNHGGAGNGPESYSNRGMNGNGASNGGGDIEMGDDRKSGGSTRNSMRSRHSADEEDSTMSLPFEPCTLTFHDLHYMVPLPAQMKDSPSAIQGPGGSKELELLRGISGAFRPETLTALMGVTGAGKTTLMDVLAGRKTGGRIEGDIRLNGHPKVQDTFARVSGYVEQTDIHDPFTTVHEALRFSAHLRINGGPDNATVEQFVEEVMSLVELEPLREALVGRPGSSGLSVEQRKRLTIAVELVANPSIIFMDEPTSGLDARAANIVMRCVKSIVQTGRTIVSTIHQPSIDIFEQFDELVLLKRGGETIYCGPLGLHSKELIAYFQGVKGVPEIEEGINPATWMLEVSSVGSESRLGISFADVYKDSKFAKDYQQVIDEFSSPREGSQPLHFDTKFATSTLGQYKWLTWRYFITYWRTTEYNAVRYFLTIFIAIFFSFVMWALGGRVTTQNGIQTSAGALYASTVFIGIINSISVQPIIAQQRGVMYRERAAGTYSIFPWFSGICTLELLYGTIQTLIFSAALYFASGFARRADKFWWFTLFLWFTLLWWTLFGMTAVALTPNVKVSAVVSSNFYSLANLFAGFVAPRPTVPGWWVWMSWLCPETYMIEGLVASQIGDYDDQRLRLAGGGFTTPRQYMKDYYGYRSSFLGQCVAILVCWLISLFVMSYLAFRYINHLKR